MRHPMYPQNVTDAVAGPRRPSAQSDCSDHVKVACIYEAASSSLWIQVPDTVSWPGSVAPFSGRSGQAERLQTTSWFGQLDQ